MEHEQFILLEKYKVLKPVIGERLEVFKEVGKKSEKELFVELCFCLCTPQSKAYACDKAVKELQRSGLLFSGNESRIKEVLVSSGVRFHHHKAKYIVGARKLVQQGLLQGVFLSEDKKAREMLVEQVKGLGYKEATHFLRNIGRAEELAILDRHILKNLKKYKAVRIIPKTLTKKKYLMIEKKMKGFAQEVKMPLQHLDLLFWAEETGKVFK